MPWWEEGLYGVLKCIWMRNACPFSVHVVQNIAKYIPIESCTSVKIFSPFLWSYLLGVSHHLLSAAHTEFFTGVGGGLPLRLYVIYV